MITQIQTIEELKQIFVEIMLNKTNKITKVSAGSVENGIAFGVAKLGQKNLAGLAVLEGHIFPEVAHGNYLDDIAKTTGNSQRFGDRQSSTYMRIVADPGTIYTVDGNIFKSLSGTEFQLEKSFVVGSFGYGYAKVRSITSGSETNVQALNINTVTNPPVGHQYCINEYQSQYGSNVEEDDLFSRRIREGVNVLSRDTLSQYEQSFMKINQNILKIYFTGRDEKGKNIISIATINGIDLTSDEINDLLIRANKYLSINDMKSIDGSGSPNIILKNIDWQPIDISMRIQLESSFEADEVRKEIQIRIAKYLDYRYWSLGDRLEWDLLLEIVKNTDGVRYVDDNFFYPRSDIITDKKKLPRIRGFQILDINGNLIQDFQGNLNPIYYPNQIDYIYQYTVLQTL